MDVTANRKRQLTDLVTALSLANLAFLGRWSELLGVQPPDAYSMRLPPRPLDFEALMVDVCVLGVMLFGAATCARRTVWSRSLLGWGLTLFLVFPLNALRIVLAAVLPFLGGGSMRGGGPWMTAALGVGAFAGIALVIGAGRSRLLRFVSTAALVTAPLVLITFSRAALQIERYRPERFLDRPTAAPVAAKEPERRILWLIFDEMAERQAFANRTPGLRLAELDGFRDQSFYATQAYSPARRTLEALPSLITGKWVRSAQALGPDDLLLQFDNGATGHLQHEETIFSRARNEGIDTALAGWYHPYCRLLNDSLTGCEWSEFDFSPQSNSSGERLADVAISQARSLVETSNLSPLGQSLTTLHHVRIYQEVLAAGTAFAANPRLGLVMVHFPVPHRPFIYNSVTGRLDKANTPAAGYDDALALVDQTLGQLRRSMEATGVWDRTAVLISSDHGFRFSNVDRGQPDRWVPFLFRLPGHHQSLRYDQPVETVLTADLLLQVLEGHIQTVDGVSSWLDKCRSRYASSGRRQANDFRQPPD